MSGGTDPSNLLEGLGHLKTYPRRMPVPHIQMHINLFFPRRSDVLESSGVGYVFITSTHNHLRCPH